MISSEGLCEHSNEAGYRPVILKNFYGFLTSVNKFRGNVLKQNTVPPFPHSFQFIIYKPHYYFALPNQGN
jgi:hypothetical protein